MYTQASDVKGQLEIQQVKRIIELASRSATPEVYLDELVKLALEAEGGFPFSPLAQTILWIATTRPVPNSSVPVSVLAKLAADTDSEAVVERVRLLGEERGLSELIVAGRRAT